jgi:hypothetical protein
MVVTPPAAAARLPVSIVSLCSSPAAQLDARQRPGKHMIAAFYVSHRRAWAGDLRPEVADNALHDQHAADLVAIGGRIDQARVEERQRSLLPLGRAFGHHG